MFITLAQKKNITAKICSRSSHNKPTPVGGGIVFASVSYITAIFFNNSELKIIFNSCILLAILGFLDDLYGINKKTRLIIQFCTATLILQSFGPITEISCYYFSIKLAILSLPISLLIIMWSTNLFNFMDGINGLATMEGIFIFIGGGIIFYLHNEIELAYLLILLSAPMFGFIYFNLPKPRLFMGDAGSYFIGTLVASFALFSNIVFNIPILLWGILYSAFYSDATITLCRRILQQQPWYQPHRQHAYQRLQTIHWSHAKITLVYSIINIILLILMILAIYKPHFILPAFIAANFITIGFYIFVEKQSPMVRKNTDIFTNHVKNIQQIPPHI